MLDHDIYPSFISLLPVSVCCESKLAKFNSNQLSLRSLKSAGRDLPKKLSTTIEVDASSDL